LDSSRNVYVFGPSVGDGTNGVSALVKYDSGGHPLWVARNSGAYPNYAFPNSAAGKRSMALDPSGNVCLTGVFWPATNNSPDIVTAKYDRNGNKLWSAFFNSAPNYSYDAPCPLAVDSRSNVYVAGFSGEFAGTEDFVTIKYDVAGNQRWMRRYNGTGNSQDIPVAVAVDTLGNVHVTGWSFSSA